MSPADVPAELVEKAARAIFACEQCDKRQAKGVPYQWNTRLDEADREEYRDLARHALAAALDVEEMVSLIDRARQAYLQYVFDSDPALPRMPHDEFVARHYRAAILGGDQ